MKIQTLTIVGVGLIGGSIGLAAKSRGLAGHIVGVGRQRSSLDEALAVGAIDEASLDLAETASRSSLVVFCTPVDRIVEQVLSVAGRCAAGTLLTDAGSTKEAIVHGIEGQLPADVHFVGSHPLAGSEKKGPRFADPNLYVDRLAIVTRTPRTDAAALDRTAAFWQSLGCRVRVMDPQDHDRALAMTSHLPHLAASALAGLLPDELRDFCATGFRDTTRVAAGDPSIWTGIFEQNRSALLAALDLLEARIVEYRRALELNDRASLDRLLVEGKKARTSLDC